MSNKLISVIVPVYNSEPYLHRLIDSFLNQTYSNFEIIIINDGSFDESEGIIKEYNDARIRYYKQDNHGVSFARNRGIELANGEYVCFVDSDDCVDNTYLEALANSLIIEESDLSICGYKVIENNIFKKIMNVDNKNEYEDILVNALKRKPIYYSLWNKMFKKSIIMNNMIRFIENVTNVEDIEFTIHYLSCIKYVSFIDEPLYNYYRHDGSASFNRKKHKYFDNNWLTEEIAINEIKKHVDDKYQKYLSIMFADYCSHILDLLVYYDIYDDRYNNCLNLLRKNILKCIALDDESLKSKIKLLVISINPRFIFGE